MTKQTISKKKISTPIQISWAHILNCPLNVIMQESYQYDSQCIIDFNPQIAFKKNENKFYLCLRQHCCIWGMNIFMNNSAVRKNTITRQRVSESNFLLFYLRSFSWSLKYNTLEKHRVSYWIMIAPLHQFPVSCLLGDLEIPPEQQQKCWSVLLYTDCQTL